MSLPSTIVERAFLMTRSLEDVNLVLVLNGEGFSKRAISIQTGVSRATIREWIGDPNRALIRTSQRLSGVTRKSCLGACEPWRDIDERAFTYLLGMYLGDGCISEHARAYRLRIACADAYPLIKDEVEAAINRILPVKVGRVQCIGCTEVGAYSSHWPCFFPQHGKGRKHERSIVLERWQQEIVGRYPRPFIRGLIHSDGCRLVNVAVRERELWTERRTYTRYQFTNRSDDIRGLFGWALDLIGVHWTQSNRWVISVSRRKDVHYLDSFVGPKR